MPRIALTFRIASFFATLAECRNEKFMLPPLGFYMFLTSMHLRPDQVNQGSVAWKLHSRFAMLLFTAQFWE
jgi:hypothetical protein